MHKVVALCLLLLFTFANADCPANDKPDPKCLSQTYQALNLLYDFGADAMSQDIAELKSDFASLTPVVRGINDFCEPKIKLNSTDPVSADGDCSDDLDRISEIINNFREGDPTCYLNVIQAVQDLWDIRANFTNDCAAFLFQRKQCKTLEIEAFMKIFKISEDVMENNIEEVVKGFKSFRETILSLNQFCETKLNYESLPKLNLQSSQGCLGHLVELKQIIKQMKNPYDLMHDVWNLIPRFLHDC